MDKSLWESLYDCPIDVSRLHRAAGITYAMLWGSDATAEAPEAPRAMPKHRPLRLGGWRGHTIARA